MEEIKLYSPLHIQVDDTNHNFHDGNIYDDEFYDESDTLIDLPEDAYIEYENDIKTDIEADEKSMIANSMKDRFYMDYFDKDKYPQIDKKVHSMRFSVERVGDKLMGVTILKVEEPLTPSDMEVIKAEAISQMSDGFGECLEQKPIITNDGDLYVSFWRDTNWSVKTIDELLVNIQSRKNLHSSVSDKPNAPMIGADGNVFVQLGIASKALKHAGQYDKTSEMTRRVMEADSYDKALAVICEYVNPVEKDRKPHNRER